jgi:alkanesulfonate monooxygenase SsuD/methylene tetrahydromethanopterin reductase-like flavin-dependent oxidoreductase (luciferase family)
MTASDRVRVGVLIPSTMAPEKIAGNCRLIENLGFDELWIAEDYFFAGGIAGAAYALAATTRIPVGLGILAAVARHPAVTAMEVATLARAYPGRLMTGIGHGVPAWTKQMGLYPKSPLATLRQVIESTRDLLAGKTLNGSEGPFEFHDVTLFHPVSEPVEIYAGVIGPKSLELAGELADGTVMSVISAPEYLRFSREHIAKGAKRVGRDGTAHKIPTYVIYNVDEDGERARSVAREALAFYLQAVGPTPMTGVYGINDKLADILALGEPAAIRDALPDEWIDIFTIAGTPTECIAKIREFHDAGATSVVLAPFPPEEGERMIELTSQAVLPGLV